MNFQSQVAHALDEEHRVNLDLLGKVEQAFARMPRSGASQDPELARMAAGFARHLEHDVDRHFDFEEQALFPRLADAGEGDIAELFAEEHAAIREAARAMLPLAMAAAEGELDDAGWRELKVGALEIVERQVSHIQKETMALLPVLEDLLDEDTDRELAFTYASG